MEFADELDLDLAWRKTKRDFGHHMNSFVSTPYVIDILDRRQDQWLADLRERLADEVEGGGTAHSQYEPRAPRIIDVPSPNTILGQLVCSTSRMLSCIPR